MRTHPLATLVTLAEDGLCADHIPLLVHAAGEDDILLHGHVARANPVWRSIETRADALAIFQDAGGYITPSWYATKAQTGKVVPTWNYVAVHAYGKARAIHDPAWLRGFLTRLTATHEAARPAPWQLSDAPADYVEAQLKAIVGIEITVSRLIGKWKMSQNRQPQDIDGVVAGLRAMDDPKARAMADEVEKRRPRS
jgi:transcriptional regulator